MEPLQGQSTAIRGDGVPEIVAAGEQRVHGRLHPLWAQLREDDDTGHPHPLANDTLEDTGTENAEVVRDAEADVQTCEDHDVGKAENTQGHVGEHQQVAVRPFACEALVGVHADQRANRANHTQDGGEELLGEMRPLRVLRGRVCVEVERGATHGKTDGSLDQEEGIYLGNDGLQHQGEAYQHHSRDSQRGIGIDRSRLVSNAEIGQQHSAREHQEAEEASLLLLHQLFPRISKLFLRLRGLLQAILQQRDEDEADERDGQDEGQLRAIVRDNRADASGREEAAKIQAKPNVGHQRRALFRLRTHFLRILGLRQQVAHRELKLHQEQATDESSSGEVVLRHKADAGATKDSKHRCQ
mmetsp:Transcript_98157/g.282205  ORF Transcript_98157/g.282205 Transcript_98157/m.282205 type:complete len:356 (-) Transcript_98157:181-1248(-)